MASNSPKKKSNKRKTPSNILKYFKKATRMMPRASEPNIGTPSTVASNDLQGTPATPRAAAVESTHNNIGGASTAKAAASSAAVQRHRVNNSTCTPPSSDNSQLQMKMSMQTPPSPHDNLESETPPSPASDVMNIRSFPLAAGMGNFDTSGYVIKSKEEEFGTPMSDDEVSNTDFDTPASVENETNRKESSAKFATPSNNTLQSTNCLNTDTPQTIKGHNKPRKKSQLYLDLGQKSFASHKICPICSSLIVHGTHEDQQNHINICKSYKEGVTCLGFKKERCVGRFGDERILEVREGDVQGRKKVEEVKCIVDGELGFASSNKQATQNDLLHGMTSYLYISKKRIVGLLLVKRIHRAYELQYEHSDGKTHSISRGTTPHPAILGIHQIWVHNLHRHKGIATKLLESARGNFTFGMVIPIEKVAFSSPTEDGVGLAKKYIGEDEKVLVYDVC